jgi:type I restriction enzyme, R subunit
VSVASERRIVQAPLLRYAEAVGWEYVAPEQSVRLRRGESGLVFWEVLVEQLQRLNPSTVSAARAELLAERLIRVRPSIEGNLDAWEFLRGLKTVFVEEESRERNFRLIDPEGVEQNVFHVTDEWMFTNGTQTVRADVVFVVNGVPVMFVETKAATHRAGIGEAFDQIVRYHREAPELLALLQLQSLTNLVRFAYGTTWNLSERSLFDWREEAAGNFETLVKTFVHPRRVLRVLTDFILFTRSDDELSKVVLRPHQMRAVERVVARAESGEKRRGLVWHTQGSGKTYTMIVAAKKLIEHPVFENPTVLMLVDRNELEAQLFQNLEAVGIGQAEVAQSKRHLRQLLAEDRRGLIVSMIHKFNDIPEGINKRANVFVLVDEAHRSTGGDLGNYLMGALPNATYIGFTGTPIDRSAHGRGTFKVFGVDDPETRYLDKYSIRESIRDGTTVPLHYALAPNELRVDPETLDREFLDLAAVEGVSDIDELNRVLERAVTLKNMLKNPERVATVSEYVARHFRENVEPMGYKAFLVAVDREACCRYKEALDEHLPPETSRIMISRGFNDPAGLAQYHLSDEEEQRVRKAFRKPDEQPQILIVTEKLLTGYDAPILYAMYLDKPMRDHVLLQAIARVNRPYEDEERRKTAGFVLDFVGIFEKLEKALAFDSSEIEGVVTDLAILFERFDALMAEGRTSYLQLVAGRADDKMAEAVLNHFRAEELRERFYAYFRELEEVYEILSPDARLRPYIDDFASLGAIYRLLRASYEPGVDLSRSFLRKTETLVQDLTEAGEILDPEKVYELGDDALQAIAESDKPDTVKVFNLVKLLERLVHEGGLTAPHLVPIGQRAQEIVQAFEQRQIDTQEALGELENLIGEVGEAKTERDRSDLSAESFAVYWLLDRKEIPKADEVARKAEAAFSTFPHWKTSEAQEREVRVALLRALIEAGVTENAADLGSWLLDLLRRSPR